MKKMRQATVSHVNFQFCKPPEDICDVLRFRACGSVVTSNASSQVHDSILSKTDKLIFESV